MPEFTNHPQGTVCYTELTTGDTAAAGDFYRTLFGWEATHQDLGPMGIYTLFHLDGKCTAAMYPLQPEQLKNQVPPHWETYFSVDDCDAATAHAAALGATVLVGSMDVEEYGRMSVIADPVGAVFCIWQSGSKIGIECRDENNTLCWSELMTTDTAASGDFYIGLLGWEKADMDMGDGEIYSMMGPSADQPAVGMVGITEAMGPIPPHWQNYFQVADIQASLEKALKLGGETMVPVTPIKETGFFCVLKDPTGAVFGLYQRRN